MNQNSIRHNPSIIKSIADWFSALFNLEDGVDREGTIIYIKTNKRMQGANAWMLICSIMIASIGLDLNSPAVIIGAMLISPLMSPILGVGLGVAINDRDTLFISLRHFGISILIALVTSTIYFSITPFGDFTNEIEARTSPTLLDGLVAIFGGLAGIISTTRKDKSNAIPGVAIATALMPPLCVTGFGLANLFKLDFDVAWGIAQNSFYLFFLNSFFIATTAYLIIKVLNFPLRTFVDKSEARRNRIFLVIFSLLIIIPSIQILVSLYQERQDKKMVETFIEENIERDGRQCQIFEISKEGEDRIFYLEIVSGRAVPEDSIKILQELIELEHDHVRIEFLQSSLANQEELNKINLRFKNLEEVQQKIEEAKKIKTDQDLLIQNLQNQLDSIQNNYTIPLQTYRIIRKAFPELTTLYFAPAQTNRQDSTVQMIPTFILSWKRGKTRASKQKDNKTLYETLTEATQFDTLKLVEDRSY